MAKKIAVLIRDRQDEALRMALGLILMDDIIDVYILDRKVEDTDENKTSIETMRDMDMNVTRSLSFNVQWLIIAFTIVVKRTGE